MSLITPIGHLWAHQFKSGRSINTCALFASSTSWSNFVKQFRNEYMPYCSVTKRTRSLPSTLHQTLRNDWAERVHAREQNILRSISTAERAITSCEQACAAAHSVLAKVDQSDAVEYKKAQDHSIDCITQLKLAQSAFVSACAQIKFVARGHSKLRRLLPSKPVKSPPASGHVARGRGKSKHSTVDTRRAKELRQQRVNCKFREQLLSNWVQQDCLLHRQLYNRFVKQYGRVSKRNTARAQQVFRSSREVDDRLVTK